MKIHIDEVHSGGLVVEGQANKSVTITYSIVDGESSRTLDSNEFDSYPAAERYLAEHFPGCERWNPPPPTADEIDELERCLKYLEKEGDRRWKYVTASLCGIWARLGYYLHQRSLPANTVARIRAVLAGNPFEAGN